MRKKGRGRRKGTVEDMDGWRERMIEGEEEKRREEERRPNSNRQAECLPRG
jgi:hypothetical protein